MKEKAEKFWKEEEKTIDAEYEVGETDDTTEVESSDEPRKEKPKKIKLESEKVRDGLAQLVLTVVELLRELMEKQAIRRIEAGRLTEEQIENLGNTFMGLKKEIEKLKDYFKLEDEDLNLSLGPLTVKGETTDEKTSVVEILDRLLGKGVVVRGDVVISVAEVDLVSLNIGLLLASIDKAKELYSRDVNTEQLEEEVKKLREENLRLKNAKNKV